MRALIRKADPGVVEEWKWMGTPVWSHDGIVCTGESYEIDIHEGETVDASAFQALIRAAVAFNASKAKTRRAK